MKAWVIDSLGTGSNTSPICSKIEAAFAPGRARFSWESCSCRCQEEAECGPRTILAMRIILEGLVDNLPIEVCVQKATLTQYPYNTHSPNMIRERIAHFVNEYSPEMATPPIRIRRQSGRITTPATSASNTRESACEILDD